MSAMKHDPALLTAPGAQDLTFGSLLVFMMGQCFQRVETLDRMQQHRFYTECKLCGGNDQGRDHYKTTTNAVVHTAECSIPKHWPRLSAMANEGVT